METLYQLTSDYNQVIALLGDDEYDKQALQDTLASIEGAIEVKAHNIVKLIKSMNTDAIDAEIKRLTDRKKAINNRKDGLKQYLQTQMELLGKDKIKGELFTWTIKNNPPALEITDSSIIPAKYQVVSYSVDNTAIKSDLKAGAEVPGARLTQGRSLTIR